MSGSVTIDFEKELATIATGTAQKLKTRPGQELLGCCGSYVASKAIDKDKVVLRVKRGANLWNPHVQTAIDNALREREGGPASLEVQYV